MGKNYQVGENMFVIPVDMENRPVKDIAMDAVKKTGLSTEVITRISSSASAMYQVGTIKIIDVKRMDDHIRSFPVAFDFEDTKSKKLRGSKFVREILRSQQGCSK